MQTTAIRTVANSLPQNEVILLTLLISKRYIPYTDLLKIIADGYKKTQESRLPALFCVLVAGRTETYGG